MPSAKPPVPEPAKVLTTSPVLVLKPYWKNASAQPPGLMLELSVAEVPRMVVAASVVAVGATGRRVTATV